MQYVDLFTWLRGDILVKADKMTMANSLELRVPFVDRPPIEWLWRQPAAFKSDRVDFDALREHGWFKLPIADAPLADGRFPTASGRCTIDSQDCGVPDFVANYESAASAPELAARFPLAMISPPARNFLNSSFVNVKSLRDIEGEPLVEMHALDAASRGVANGQLVRVFNDRGSYLCKAVVNKRARPGVVNGLGVWWRKLGAAGTNVNELTHQRLTDIGRAPSFYDCLVEVEPAGAARR